MGKQPYKPLIPWIYSAEPCYYNVFEYSLINNGDGNISLAPP